MNASIPKVTDRGIIPVAEMIGRKRTCISVDKICNNNDSQKVEQQNVPGTVLSEHFTCVILFHLLPEESDNVS